MRVTAATARLVQSRAPRGDRANKATPLLVGGWRWDHGDHNPAADIAACFFTGQRRGCPYPSFVHIGRYWMRASVVLAAALATAAATAAPAPGASTYTPGSLVTASSPASPFTD